MLPRFPAVVYETFGLLFLYDSDESKDPQDRDRHKLMMVVAIVIFFIPCISNAVHGCFHALDGVYFSCLCWEMLQQGGLQTRSNLFSYRLRSDKDTGESFSGSLGVFHFR